MSSWRSEFSRRCMNVVQSEVSLQTAVQTQHQRLQTQIDIFGIVSLPAGDPVNCRKSSETTGCIQEGGNLHINKERAGEELFSCWDSARFPFWFGCHSQKLKWPLWNDKKGARGKLGSLSPTSKGITTVLYRWIRMDLKTLKHAEPQQQEDTWWFLCVCRWHEGLELFPHTFCGPCPYWSWTLKRRNNMNVSPKLMWWLRDTSKRYATIIQQETF